MGGLFSKKSKSHPPSANNPSRTITEQDKAVLQLKSQRDKLQQYRRRQEMNIERERNVAKKLVQEGKKEKALYLLKKKRYFEQLIEKTLNELDNIERMIHDVEFAQNQMNVVDALKHGNECLKKMHDALSLDDVEKIMEETREAVEYQREIDQLVSGSLTEEDEEEVEAELNELLEEQGQTAIPEFPEVPKDRLPTAVREKQPAKKERQRMEPMLAS